MHAVLSGAAFCGLRLRPFTIEAATSLAGRRSRDANLLGCAAFAAFANHARGVMEGRQRLKPNDNNPLVAIRVRRAALLFARFHRATRPIVVHSIVSKRTVSALCALQHWFANCSHNVSVSV